MKVALLILYAVVVMAMPVRRNRLHYNVGRLDQEGKELSSRELGDVSLFDVEMLPVGNEDMSMGIVFGDGGLSMSMNTDAPTPSPTPCELTDGTKFTFNSYIMEKDIKYDDVYVHQQFDITVKCDCNGKAVNGGTEGPTSKVGDIEGTEVDGPWVNQINNKDLQVEWEGAALEGDAPGWTVSATGLGLCFTPAAKVGVCILIAGLASEIFDDEILWAYRRSATFTCVKKNDEWEVKMTEKGAPPFEETFKTNDSEWYTKYDSTSTAAGANVPSVGLAVVDTDKQVTTRAQGSDNEVSSHSSSSSARGARFAVVTLIIGCVCALVV